MKTVIYILLLVSVFVSGMAVNEKKNNKEKSSKYALIAMAIWFFTLVVTIGWIAWQVTQITQM